MHLAPDDRIGHYRVERVLAVTSTSTTYAAIHLVLPRRAVIKLAHPAHAARVLREACIVEALHHPGVPVVYEFGVVADRRPWFAIERVDGMLVADEPPLGALGATVLVRDVAAVLAHVHRRGVTVCGLSPDRIARTPHRAFPVCITDWSDARTHDAARVVPHRPSGTRVYLAPELARGDAIDDRVDIYALGVIAFVAITGRPPTMIERTHDARPDLPRELASIIDQMRALDRYDRPSAAEVQSDLAWLANALAHDAAPSGAIEDVVLVDTAGVPAAASPRSRNRGGRWTPTYAMVTPETAATVAGEITTTKS